MSETPKDPNKEDVEAQARQALRQKYADTIRRLWIKPDDCPICGSNTWATGDLIETPLRRVSFDARTAVLSSMGTSSAFVLPQAYVYIPVACTICGYSMFFHTGVLDVRDEEEVKAVPPIRVPGT